MVKITVIGQPEYQITLSKKEAEDLLCIVGKIAGDTKTTPRGVASAIYNQLIKLKLVSTNCRVSDKYGTISFL